MTGEMRGGGANDRGGANELTNELTVFNGRAQLVIIIIHTHAQAISNNSTHHTLIISTCLVIKHSNAITHRFQTCYAAVSPGN